MGKTKTLQKLGPGNWGTVYPIVELGGQNPEELGRPSGYPIFKVVVAFPAAIMNRLLVEPVESMFLAPR